MRTSRRQFFRVTAGGLVAATGLCGRGPFATAQMPTLKIGTAVLGDYALIAPVVIGLDKGFFKAQGVNAEFQPFRGGPTLLKAVVANEIQIGITGATDVPVFRAQGAPVRYVATSTKGNHFTFNVAPDITKVADLKGKSIGVTGVGATTWISAVMLAKQQGWDPERDVKIVALGGLDAQLAALARGEIQAYVWGDGGAVTELQGKTKILLRLDTLTPKWLSQGIYCTDSYIGANKDAIARALRAMFQAIKLIRSSPNEAFGIVAKTIGWPEQAVARAHAISGPLLSDDGAIDVEAIEVMQNTLLDLKVQSKRVPTQDLYTTEFTPVRV
jgi:NitT/TauT family transport system substrate-binding protein